MANSRKSSKASSTTTFRTKRTSVPAEEEIQFLGRLEEIKNFWAARCKAVGDRGACVIGAGFTFNTPWGANVWFSPPPVYQGEWSWLGSKDDVQQMLLEAGATDIRWDYGAMD